MMSESTPSVSTRQASELLGVHESTVKRLCNGDELACQLTPGGHRRIPLQDLLSYAQTNRYALPLLRFNTDAESVWEAAEGALHTDDFRMLIELLYRWLENDPADLPAQLLLYLGQRGIQLPVLFDRLVGPVLHRIGNRYLDGALSIGEEHRMTQSIRDTLFQLRTLAPSSPCDPDRTSPVAVVGCARNEAHELGALMVRQTLEELGWRVIYLGLDVPTEDFASQQRKHAAALVCVSVVPPTGSAEAVAMHRLLSQMADPATPYRLAFGGSSLCDAGRLLPPSQGVTDVRFFDRLEPFATWIGRPV